MPSSQRIFAVILRQWYEFMNQWHRIFDTFLWPIFDLFWWGLTFMYFDSSSSGFSFLNLILGTIVLYSFMYTIQKELTFGMLTDVWDRNFFNLFATPLKTSELLIGSMIVAFAKTLLVAVVMSIGVYLIYDFSIFTMLPVLFQGFLTITLFGVFFGIITMGFIFHLGQHVQTFTWNGIFLFIPLMCIYYPVSTLPDFLEPFAWALPPTYFFEYARNFLLTGAIPAATAWIAPTLINLLLLVLGILYFQYAFQHAKNRGWLVKMD